MGSFNGLPARTPARTPAAPARFDGANQHRRAMLAKVHIAKVQLGLADDDYRAVLMRVAGRTSAGDCTDRELADLLAEFKAKGFSAEVRRPGGARSADHPVARKARALWIGLGCIGAIADPSEAALEAFARRQLGCVKLQWANQAHGSRLIDALKAIAERHGWSQSLAGIKPGMHALVLSRNLVDALVAKLKATGLIPADWSVQRIAFDLTGIELSAIFGAPEELHRLAAALGVKLREAGK
ncbi:gp16 family protein [Sphingomonas sp.]|uniref:gp16 family protein n=1 Tax=Sphingomonas sp. TaxID=28214 RepID=UPI003CC5528D